MEIGLSPQTVDTYLKVAMNRLGASNRRDAARKLAGLEASQKSGSPSPTIAKLEADPHSLKPTGGTGALGIVLPPPIGGRENTLGFVERSFAVLRVAVIGATVVIALALLIAGAFKAFR